MFFTVCIDSIREFYIVENRLVLYVNGVVGRKVVLEGGVSRTVERKIKYE